MFPLLTPVTEQQLFYCLGIESKCPALLDSAKLIIIDTKKHNSWHVWESRDFLNLWIIS